MLYENYKSEDGYFLNHLDEWTGEEMKEILSTFPETKFDQEKIKAVEQLIEDIEIGVLKVNRYGDINAASAKAYANKHSEFFYYRSASYRYDASLCIRAYGDDVAIKSKWKADGLLRDLKDNEKKFKTLVLKYRQSETNTKQRIERENYEELHKARIAQGQRTYIKMRQTDLGVVMGIENTGLSHTYYSPHKEVLHGYDYIDKNNYDEVTYKGKVISLEASKELEKACDELAREVADIIDIYQGKFKDILRRGIINESKTGEN